MALGRGAAGYGIAKLGNSSLSHCELTERIGVVRVKIALQENSPKVAQINIRLTAEQQRLFKQHCNRNGMNTQAAVVEALKRVIDGF